jgi:DNA-binding XRE family transcriptional regulator
MNCSLHSKKKTSHHRNERPLTVREAAKFLGVSSQTVYLWVEKQIPHLRVMD